MKLNPGTYKVEITNNHERWYDANGNCIHIKDSTGYESWYEYDANGNRIHYKDSDGYERWQEYDANGNRIHYKDSDGFEVWYDVNGKQITNGKFDQLYNSAPCNGKIVEIDGCKYQLKELS